MFKQDNKEGNKARLFSHRAEDVIPLLYGHLPKSLPVLSTILANSLDSTRTAQPGNDLESSPPVYLTFPVEDLIQPPDFWVAIIPTWQAREPHARIFVSPLPASPASSSSAPAPSPIVSPDCNARSAEAESRAAESLVHATAVALVDLLGPAVKLGAVPTEWADVVRAVIGGEDNEECSVFLAPSAPTSITSGPHSHPITNSREEGDELDRLRELGLVWDRGREEDLDIVSSKLDPGPCFQSSHVLDVRSFLPVALGELSQLEAGGAELTRRSRRLAMWPARKRTTAPVWHIPLCCVTVHQKRKAIVIWNGRRDQSQ